MLFLCPQLDESQVESPPALIRLFDCDGGLVNELEMGSAGGNPAGIELDPLLERCKLESGLRHGHLMVEHAPEIRPVCRLQNRAGAVISGASLPITQAHAMFSPVCLSPERSSLVTLVNYGAVEAQVRVRLMFSSRSPDVIYSVPPFGAKVVCLEQEFFDVLVSGFGKPAGKKSEPKEEKPERTFPETRAYVRVSVRNEQHVGVQLIESMARGEQGTVFTALSW